MKRINQIIFIFSLFNTCLSHAMWTPLLPPFHQAVADGNLGRVRLLLDAGEDVNAADNNGYTPLHRAAINGHTAIVRLLLDRGAEVNVAEKLFDHTPLFCAVISKCETIVNALMDAGADVNAANKRGYTPLHETAREGHEVIVNLLLERGANVNAADNKDGFTPLDLAKKHGHTKVITLLKSWSNDEKKETDQFEENFKKHRFSNGFRFMFNNVRFLNNGWLQKGAVTTVFVSLIILGYRLFKRRYHLFKRR